MKMTDLGLATDSGKASSSKDSVSLSAKWLVLTPVSSCQDLGVSTPIGVVVMKVSLGTSQAR